MLPGQGRIGSIAQSILDYERERNDKRAQVSVQSWKFVSCLNDFQIVKVSSMNLHSKDDTVFVVDVAEGVVIV